MVQTHVRSVGAEVFRLLKRYALQALSCLTFAGHAKPFEQLHQHGTVHANILYVSVLLCVCHISQAFKDTRLCMPSQLFKEPSSVCAQHKPDRIHTSCNAMLNKTAVLYICRSYTLVQPVMARTGLNPQKPPLTCPAQPQPTNLSLHRPPQIPLSLLVQLQIPHLAGGVQNAGGGPKQKLTGRKFEQL